MKLAIALAAVLLSVPAFAQVAPVGSANLPPSIDFSQTIKTPMGKPFLDCSSLTGTPKESCDQNNSLRWVSYQALAAPVEARQPGSMPSIQDYKNQVLGDKIGSSMAPLDLTTDEKSELKAALFRGLASPAMAYAACLMIVPKDECSK